MAVNILFEADPGFVHYDFDGSILVEVGDLMFHDSDDVKPASSQADQGTELANQILFAKNFAGIAGDSRTASDTGAVTGFRVIPNSVVEMDCASATFEVGDLLAVDEASGGTALEDQKLVKTTNKDAAIGKVVRREATAVTRVRARLSANVASAGSKPQEEALVLTADDSVGAGQTVTPNAARVAVTGVTNDADDFITLPALANVPDGHQIVICCNAGSNFELRTPAASSAKINTVISDGTQEYLCVDAEVVVVTKVSDTDGWAAYDIPALGGVGAATVPD